MKQYIYVQCVSNNDDPSHLSFSHTLVSARDEDDAYNKGRAASLDVLPGFQFANDYVAVV